MRTAQSPIRTRDRGRRYRGVLGLSSSSGAALNAEIAALGTNLLTVQPGQRIASGNAELPVAAPAMIARLPGVYQVQSTGATNASVYHSPRCWSGFRSRSAT